MVTTSSPSGSSRQTTSRNRLLVLLIVLLLLAATAVYTWTLPGRREKELQSASLAQLNEMAKQEPGNPRVFYYLGKRLQEQGKLTAAHAAFQHASELDIDDEEAWLAWAAAAQSMGNGPETFTTLTLYLKQHPKSAAAHRALGLFYYTQENYVRAHDEALTAAKLKPEDVASWRLAGVTALQMETYSAAEEAFRKAIALDPKDARSLLGLGDALDKEERRPDALEWYRKAQSVAPNEWTTTLAVGRMMLLTAKSPAEIIAAREQLERANQMDTAGGRALIWLGRAYAREQQWDKARKTLEEAKERFPNVADVAFALQPVYVRLGDSEKAKAEGKRHAELYDYSLKVYNLQARLHEAKGDLERDLRLELCRLYVQHHEYNKAVREYQRLIRRAPDLKVAQEELAELEKRQLPPTVAPTTGAPAPAGVSDASKVGEGDALLDQQRFADAQKIFLEIVRNNSRDPLALQGLGLALAGQEKTAEAFTVLKQALKVDPSLPKAQYAIARLYLRSGLTDEAIRWLEKLVQQVPDEPEYLHGLGVCYLTTNQAPKAISMFSRACNIKSDVAVYWAHLANAEVFDQKTTEAEQHYRYALQISSADVEAKVGLAKLLLKHDVTPARQEEAEKLFRAVLSAESLNSEALLGLGHLLVDRKQFSEAITHLENLINHNADLPEAYFQLAKAYDRLGNKKRADYCRQAFSTISKFQDERDNTVEQVRLHLKDPALRLKLARLYARGGQYPQAVNQYQMCLYLDGKNKTARKEMADLTAYLKKSGQMSSALVFNDMVSSSLAGRKP